MSTLDDKTFYKLDIIKTEDKIPLTVATIVEYNKDKWLKEQSCTDWRFYVSTFLGNTLFITKEEAVRQAMLKMSINLEYINNCADAFLKGYNEQLKLYESMKEMLTDAN